MENYFYEGSKIVESKYGIQNKMYKNSELIRSVLGNYNSIGNDTVIKECKFEDHVVINRRNYINNTLIGSYTYTGLNTIINYSKIGRFCSIARNVDIGGFDHQYDTVSTMPLFRIKQMTKGANNMIVRPEYEGECEIGNDVWIAAGAQVLNKAHIGDGAIIGAGAVVTKNVEPYSIMIGIPARKIKMRFDEKIIEELLDIKWWNWPLETIEENIEWMIQSKINYNVIRKMKEINNKLGM